MAINKNHEFEEMEGIKCAIVEKNVSNERAMFLKDLLVHNGYTLVIAPAPPPKAVAKPAPKPAEETEPAKVEEPLPAPELFNVGVTDLSFNSINAVFGRQLKTLSGCVVTQAYWNEAHKRCDEEVPYYAHTKMAEGK